MAFLLQASYEQTFEPNRITFMCFYSRTERRTTSNSASFIIIYLITMKENKKKIDVEVEKVPVMSVTKRPTPAPLIDFKTSINVSRFLRPSFVWHGSLNIRVFLNDQLPVPD